MTLAGCEPFKARRVIMLTYPSAALAPTSAFGDLACERNDLDGRKAAGFAPFSEARSAIAPFHLIPSAGTG
jgi:hypothetical protein